MRPELYLFWLRDLSIHVPRDNLQQQMIQQAQRFHINSMQIRSKAQLEVEVDFYLWLSRVLNVKRSRLARSAKNPTKKESS
jgi:hypothetical protein